MEDSGLEKAHPALAKIGGTLRQTVEQYREAIGGTDLPVDVWIDEQGRATRTKTTVAFKASEATQGQSGATTTTIDFTDWGTPVSITTPNATEVADGTQLLSSFLGG